MSNELILVKYAPEIFLKGQNRGKFEKKLRDNIKKKLEGLNYEFITDQGRYFIKAENIKEATERVRKVFGVAEVWIVTEVERDLTAIKEECLKRIKEANPKTFKIARFLFSSSLNEYITLLKRIILIKLAIIKKK